MHEVKIYNTISEINKVCWDELTEDNIFMCYDWLRMSEETTINLPLPYYITINSNSKIIGASVCYLENENSHSKSIDNLLLGRFGNFKLNKKISFSPAFICGPYKGYGTHFLFYTGLTDYEINSLYEQLINEIEKISSREKVSVCFSNVMNNEIILKQILLRRRYLKTRSRPLSFVSIKWSSFNEYRIYLKNKLDQKINYEINRNKKLGVTIKQLDNTENDWQRLYNLLEMNHKKYNDYLFSLKPDYFIKMKSLFGDDAHIYTAVKDKDIIGVCAEFIKDNMACISSVGVDHEKSCNDFTYFNIAFYQPIKNAIESGIKKIYCGNGLYKTKAKRGFSIEDTFLLYKPGSRFNYLVKIWFFIHNFWMTRKLSFIKKYN
jgi:predicted N-acyltransferase